MAASCTANGAASTKFTDLCHSVTLSDVEMKVLGV